MHISTANTTRTAITGGRAYIIAGHTRTYQISITIVNIETRTTRTAITGGRVYKTIGHSGTY